MTPKVGDTCLKHDRFEEILEQVSDDVRAISLVIRGDFTMERPGIVERLRMLEASINAYRRFVHKVGIGVAVAVIMIICNFYLNWIGIERRVNNVTGNPAAGSNAAEVQPQHNNP